MKAGARLALYGAGVAMAFGGAFGLARVIAPESLVAAWEGSDMETHGAEHDAAAPQGADHSANGLSLEAAGLVLSPVDAPTTTGTDNELSFTILDSAGAPVTEFATAHEKDLHLIVVRTDGAEFRHAHPVLDATTGRWSIPWTWDEPGTYRVYADLAVAGHDASSVTLSRTVEVAGDFAPVENEVRQTDEVDGFTVAIVGELIAGSSSELTISVSRDGAPISTLEPYLGAFGHLVALREGDLAYLHAHAEGDEPRPGESAGPEIAFAAQAPTAGRYLLYLDFQVEGAVHTASFVLDAGHGARG